jgi:hypothetical protein
MSRFAIRKFEGNNYEIFNWLNEIFFDEFPFVQSKSF